ncbi:TetR/AcrR family transcriptional regulator [Actinoplanes friuliensis]|jgi:AcrR family transcriptional regulator|uniref:TetR family transcriptional regulator n=1 Tax=Actinoplanes friuliensis DSM 7358 TaxID=1246995 RepID=U5W773_9ACTN|nr:TetR/AcrR family transcriptional regulator [Actinoplanes friuliensis]AGZ43791.1 TetR family transcriptional regulator [Actinoplanes friuliensis DSM 7358]
MVRTSTRDEILSVAAEQFAHSGFKGTSLQDIAARVGCSKATLLYHFASKEAIFAEMLAPAAREFAELSAGFAALDDRAAQAAAIEGFVDLVLRYRREISLIYDGTAQFLQEPAFEFLLPLTEDLCSVFAARSTDPATRLAAEVVLAGIVTVAIDKDDEGLREALIGVAKRALITPIPHDKD